MSKPIPYHDAPDIPLLQTRVVGPKLPLEHNPPRDSFCFLCGEVFRFCRFLFVKQRNRPISALNNSPSIKAKLFLWRITSFLALGPVSFRHSYMCVCQCKHVFVCWTCLCVDLRPCMWVQDLGVCLECNTNLKRVSGPVNNAYQTQTCVCFRKWTLWTGVLFNILSL